LQVNYDLLRYLLLKIEDAERLPLWSRYFVTDEYTEKDISFHLELLRDNNFIKSSSFHAIGSPSQVTVKRMTMHGHNFLESIRDDIKWEKVSEKINAYSGSISLELIKSFATAPDKAGVGK